MPITFGELTRRIRLRCGNRIDSIRTGVLLNSKMQEIYTGYTWSWRYETRLLATEGIKADGTVTLDPLQRNLIYGTGTQWEVTDVGRNIRVDNDNTYYGVIAVDFVAVPAGTVILSDGVGGIWTLLLDQAHQVMTLPGLPPATVNGVEVRDTYDGQVFGAIALTDEGGLPWYVIVDAAGQVLAIRAVPPVPPADAVLLQAQGGGAWTLLIDQAHQLLTLPGLPPVEVGGVPIRVPHGGQVFSSIALTASDGTVWYLSVDLAGQLLAATVPPPGAVLAGHFSLSLTSLGGTADLLFVSTAGEASVQPGPPAGGPQPPPGPILEGGLGLPMISLGSTADLLTVSILGEVGAQPGPAVTRQRLTIERDYIGADFVDESYSLFRNIYSLPSDFHELISGAYWWRLLEGSIQGSDRYDARRAFSSNQPRAFIYRGEDKDGNVEIEISPVPSTAIGIRYTYTKRLPQFADTERVPFSETFLEYLTAADGLEVLAVELSETNLNDAQNLLAIAERYTVRGMTALSEARYEDFKKAGASRAVRDASEDFLYADDYWTTTDLNTPIF